MNALLKNLAVTAVVATAAVRLVACTSEACTHEAQDVTFDVRENTCGATGTLRVSTPMNECALTVTVAENTGLPGAGDTDGDSIDVRGGGWYLHDPDITLHLGPDGGVVSADAGSVTTVAGNRSCDAEPEGNDLVLRCKDRPRDLSGSVLRTCSARLTAR
ncbi:hypothetical protein HPC49_43920 [Pyxidicoccus fallax]|uniref:Lipoprotein n=1 Tax=Pyxidicoccus fallax TaxID=394095 RepID=A0A848LTG1_9BACT|nr:hypothetical protein [Pyxidicoccus fallax]NMO20684.1 hypothetical protein [Pyxidicoccus fallax]NPC85135.1 hypothetical protein [Pyxidicoccus fallax]